MYKLYKALLLLVILTLCNYSVVIAQPPCPPTSAIDIDFNPAPNPDGSFDAGTTVEICVTVTDFAGTNANWLHGFAFDFSPGWDVSSVVIINAPVACGTGGGEFIWMPNGIGGFGPGFYYDVNISGPQDGNPANNWGDFCGNEDWEFCIEITLGPSDPSTPGYCGGTGNGDTPLDDSIISPTVNTVGDGDTGSWPNSSNCIPNNTSEPITMNCCDANSGVSPGTLDICENGTFCLFDQLIQADPLEPIDPNGIWIGPAPWVSVDACGSFDPTTDPAGDYTYSVIGSDGICFNSTIITMQFIDMGTLTNIPHCDPGPLDLNVAVAIPFGLPLTGTWTFPNGGAAIPTGLVDPNSDPQGVYIYTFYDTNNCLTTAGANIIFSTGSSAGCETFGIEYCTEVPCFAPFDYLGCNPTAGGQWILYDSNDSFIDFYSTYDVCIDPGDFTEPDMYLTYVLGSPPCAPALVDLHVNISDWVNTGLATTTSICITDPPVLLESLLDIDPNGPVDVGYNWDDLSNPATGVVLTNPLVPGAYPPNTTLQLNYTGGLAGTACYNESLLILTILPADADAGLDNTINVCESDAPFDMEGELGGMPQGNGNWTFNGLPHGNFYNPAIDAPGVYTYTITTTCDIDAATLTVVETPLPSAGVPTVNSVCESDGFVDLTSLLFGSPVGGGAWTDQLTGAPVANPMNVTGQCGPGQTTLVYTVTSGPCVNFTTLGLTIECTPNAGPDVPLDYCGDGSMLNLPLILDPTAEPGGTWSVPSPVALIPANAGAITYTTPVNPLDVCPADVAVYTLNIDPAITVTPAVTTCSPNQTEYITTFTISGGVQPYYVNGGITGASFTSTATPAGTPYGFTVSDSGGCPDVSVTGPSPVCTCIATAAFTSPSTTVCAGSCTNLTITSSGLTPPFNVEYSDGTTTTLLTGIGPNHIFSVCPAVTTNYSIVSVEDANCVGTPGAGSITVSVEQAPDAGIDVSGTYCGDGSILNLFTLLPPGTDPGDFSPSSTVTLLPSNAGVFTYTTTNGVACPQDVALYTINIDPEIVVSNIATSCLASQVEYITEFTVPNGATVVDNNTGSTIPFFGTSFSSNPIAVGTPYNFTVSMAGSTCPDVSVTGPSAACSCPATADFTSMSTAICEGSCTNLEITSTGTGPFDVEYSDGTTTTLLSGIGPNHIFSVCPTANTTYSIVSVSDANCVGTPGGSNITVSVETPPNAGPDVALPDYCGDGTSLNLFTLLDPAADMTGSFIGGNSIILNSGNSGTYIYEVTGTNCPNDQANYTINIDEPLSISAVNASCLASQLEYEVTFTISGGTGPGTYTVGGIPIAGNTFTSTPIAAGLPFFFTIDDAGPCPAITENGVSPNCNCPATSSILTANTTICEGSCTNIEFENAGNGPFTLVYNDGTTDLTLFGIGTNHIISVCPTVTTTYSLVSIDDQDCTGSAFGSVTITVDQPNDAGNDVPDLVYCGDNSNILLTPAPGEPLGGDFAPSASFPATVANSGVYTYTIGGNACPDDVANYTVTIQPEISIDNLVAVCQSNQLEYTVTFVITGGVAPYFVDGVQLPGNTFNSGMVDFATNPFYNYVVMDSGSCPDVTINEPAPDCNCIAEGSFFGSTTICEGDCAQITFQGTGDAPFDITYEDSNGVPTTLVAINSGHIITVCPTSATTYTLTDVSDSYCVGVVTGSSVTVNVDTQLSATLVNEIIDANNENFQVVISVTGGDPATYSFSPPGGIYNNISQTYTSAPITCGSGYAITVSDAGVCPAVIIDSPFFDCGCVSNSGTIDATPESVCIDGTVTVTHSGDEAMDGNDILEFILHDGTAGSIQNVLGRNYDGVFDMNNYGVVAGQTYCIVAVVGTSDFFGNVMLNDPCASISTCLPITIDPLPTASISGSASVCPGETVGLTVLFTGTAPWTFTYAINATDQATEVSPTSTYILNTNIPGTYTITAVSDANCIGSGQGVATVQNFATPTATMSGNPDVCEGSGDGPIITFTGDGPWTFEYTVNGSNPVSTTIATNTYTIPATESGLYAISSLEGQYCTGTFSGTLTVNMIAQPSAIISGGGEVCDGDMATFEVVLTGQSPWNLLYTVDGLPQQPLSINASPYQFESGIEGDYVLTTLHDSGCPGQTIPSSASLIVNQLPTAAIEASTSAFCIGEEIELGFQLDGVPPFDVTYVLNSDTITMIGLLASTSEIMTPAGPITAEIINIADGSNPTCEAQPYSSLYVDASVLANAPVLEDESICSDHGPIRIGVATAPGLAYTWTPELQLSDPLASNPIFTPEQQQAGPGPKTYSYVLHATNGDCSATDTMTVTVDPGPNARFGYTPDPVLSEDTEVFFKNYTNGVTENMIYFWEFDSLDTSELENPSYKFPDGINDDYEITLTVIDATSGCMDVHSEILTVKPEMLIYVPNAFTPDGDALNDLWGPVMQNVDPDDYRLTVFDRFGTIIFTTRTLGQKWNGSENGSDHYAKSGVYVWLIETKNSISLEEVDFKGKVTLIR